MKPEALPEQVSNPYTPPATAEVRAGSTAPAIGVAETVSERSIEAFRGMRVWVLVTGWSVLPIGLLVGLSALRSLARRGAQDPRTSEEAFGSSVVSMALAVCLFASGMLLIRYSGRIKHLIISRTMADLDRAVEMQRTYWQFVGTCIAAFVLFIPFLLLLAKRFMAASSWSPT